MAATVLVNRVPYDFQSLETEIIVGSQSVTSIGVVEGLEKFDYSADVNRTSFYGTSRTPMVLTAGYATFSASISINRYWFHYLRNAAQDLGIPLANMEMKINFTYFGKIPGQADSMTHQDTLTGVRFKSIKSSGQHGSDPMQVEMPLDLLNIYWDGEDIFGNRG